MIQKKINIVFIGELIVLKSFVVNKNEQSLLELGTKVVNYKQKEMTPLTMIKIGIMKSEKNATYVEKSFVIIRIKKRDLNYTKK